MWITRESGGGNDITFSQYDVHKESFFSKEFTAFVINIENRINIHKKR